MLGHLLALTVTPAGRGDREQVAALAAEVQEVTGSAVELAYVDQGYTRQNAAEAAAEHGIRLEVVNPPKSAASCSCHGDGSWKKLQLGKPIPTPRTRLHERLDNTPKAFTPSPSPSS